MGQIGQCIFGSALSHSRRSDPLEKKKKIGCPLLNVSACGRVLSPRLYRFSLFLLQQETTQNSTYCLITSSYLFQVYIKFIYGISYGISSLYRKNAFVTSISRKRQERVFAKFSICVCKIFRCGRKELFLAPIRRILLRQ